MFLAIRVFSLLSQANKLGDYRRAAAYIIKSNDSKLPSLAVQAGAGLKTLFGLCFPDPSVAAPTLMLEFRGISDARKPAHHDEMKNFSINSFFHGVRKSLRRSHVSTAVRVYG